MTSHLLESHGYAACYSADPDGTIRHPFDDATGELIPEVWERWLALGPGPPGPDHRRRGRASIAPGDLHRRGQTTTSTSSTSVRRRSGGRCVAAGAPEPFFELFPTPSTARSSTATRSRSATSPSVWRRASVRAHRGADGRPAGLDCGHDQVPPSRPSSSVPRARRRPRSSRSRSMSGRSSVGHGRRSRSR